MATILRSSTKLPSLRPRTTIHLTPLFLQLPSNIRTRAFHASPRPQIIAEAITASHTLLETLHTTTGLPWAYTLPLFAVALRTTIFLPISIYVRSINRKQVALAPVVSAWTVPLKRQTIAESGHLGPIISQQKLQLKLRKKRVEIYRRWKCQLWRNWLPLAQLPVFLVVMETVRRMCGANRGVLGMMTGSDIDPSTSTLTADGVLSKLDVLVPLDPSLAIEGALWFPNLLVGDPGLILPFVLSASLLLNALGGHKPVNLGIWQTRLTRVIATTALMIGPVMINVPSALLVYWIGSSLSAYAQNLLLDIFMPIPKPVEPCKPKRPWRTGIGAIATAEDAAKGLLPERANSDAAGNGQKFQQRSRRP